MDIIDGSGLWVTGNDTTIPPIPPPAPIPDTTGAGTFIATGQGVRLTQPLSRAEWQRLLRGDERLNLEQRERLRLLRRMMEDDDLSLMLLL